MSIQTYFNWPSVVGKSLTSVLIVTERRLFFSNNAKPAQLESLSDHSDDRAIMQALPKNYKSVTLSKIDRIRLLEGSTHFRVYSSEGKIVVPFGDGAADAAAGHYTALIEALDGIEITSDAKVGAWDNLQYSLGCWLMTALVGGLLIYFLGQEEFDYQGRRSGIGKFLHNIAHSIGVVGVSAIVIAGVLGGAIWMYLRMKRPLRVFLATRVRPS